MLTPNAFYFAATVPVGLHALGLVVVHFGLLAVELAVGLALRRPGDKPA